ncbi:MAG: hypothetical protein J5594_04345 [Elusimicrobiaceae bacterium]|nr:hypothetical protein [Elusimicrobiaceae bacterium]
MKKLALFVFALGLITVNASAFSLTDPFFMPEAGQIVGDLSIALTNEDARFDESFAFTGSIEFGIKDRLALGFGLGWANIRHHSKGLIDPTVTMKLRILDGLVDGYYMDVDGFLSPQVFDSWQSNKGGAKGATDLGATLKIGSTELINNFTVYLGGSIKHYGHSKLVPAGTGVTALAGAKYYVDESNSFELSLNASNYIGFICNHIGAGLDINYAHEFQPNKLALVLYYGAERHNKNIVSYNHWGVKWRYVF